MTTEGIFRHRWKRTLGGNHLMCLPGHYRKNADCQGCGAVLQLDVVRRLQPAGGRGWFSLSSAADLAFEETAHAG